MKTAQPGSKGQDFFLQVQNNSTFMEAEARLILLIVC